MSKEALPERVFGRAWRAGRFYPAVERRRVLGDRPPELSFPREDYDEAVRILSWGITYLYLDILQGGNVHELANAAEALTELRVDLEELSRLPF